MSTSASESIASVTREIVSPWKGRKGGVIPILQGVQHAFGYLPGEAMEVISEETKISLAELYGVATFYAQFHLSPRGRHMIRVCRGTACHVKGSAGVLKMCEEVLGIKAGDTTRDGLFSIETVACIGACGLAPVISINGEFHAKITSDKLRKLVEDIRKTEAQNAAK